MKPIDRTEAERLVQTYSDMILRLSYTYLKSTQDAEDICQTVFLKLLTGGAWDWRRSRRPPLPSRPTPPCSTP